MTALTGGTLWWDREADSAGRPIRQDVRASAHTLWDQACLRVRTMLGDSSDAAMLMEKSVLQVSRYLDRIGAPPGMDTAGVLMSAFCRALRRHGTKLHRIEFVPDIAEVAELLMPTTTQCTAKEDCLMDAEKAARRLSPRGRTMLDLRRVGFEWKEIGQILNMSDCAARAEFSRELKRASVKIQQKERCGGSQ
jgi:hypothetical protein